MSAACRLIRALAFVATASTAMAQTWQTAAKLSKTGQTTAKITKSADVATGARALQLLTDDLATEAWLWDDAVETDPARSACAEEWVDKTSWSWVCRSRMQYGCPARACNGEHRPWCCNEGTDESCTRWHYCDNAADEDDAPDQTIVDIAVSLPGTFSTLVAALQAADLVETLSGPGPFTVFAPTDEAFAKLGSAVDDLLRRRRATGRTGRKKMEWSSRTVCPRSTRGRHPPRSSTNCAARRASCARPRPANTATRSPRASRRRAHTRPRRAAPAGRWSRPRG